MSYILGALRKAERERKGDDADQPEVDWDARTWDSGDARSASGNRWLKAFLILTAGLLLAAIFLLWMLVNSEQPKSFEENSFSNGQAESAAGDSELAIDSIGSTEQADSSGFSGDSYRTPESTEVIRSTDRPSFPEITGHLYVPANESLSRIFSDTGAFRVGHVFEDGLVLEAVSDRQATFRWQGEAYQVSFE